MNEPPHRAPDELKSGFPDILAAPADAGTPEAIVVRPAVDGWRTPDSAMLSRGGDVTDDRWTPAKSTVVQVSLINVGRSGRGRPGALAPRRRQPGRRF